MKAIQISETGGPDVLRPVEVSRPVPAPDQALVEVRAAGVNFIDIYFREGMYKAPLPFIPGQEGAGVIVEVGKDVRNFGVGDTVAWCMHSGGYAEYAAIPEAKLVCVPDAVGLEQAAAVLLQGMTAHYLATSTYPLKPIDTALVHAGAGGVGLLLTQMASRVGAHVISTVSTEEKAELARAAGAQEAIVYTKDNFESEVQRITADRGVDVVYDSVGRTTFEGSLRCLRPRGMLVLYGASSGPVPPVDPLRLSTLGSLFLTRPSLANYVHTRQELNARAGDVFQQVESGTLQVRIDQTFPLAEAANAQKKLQSRRTTGKVMLVP